MLIIRSARGKPVTLSKERISKIRKADSLSEATHMGIWDRIKCHFLGAEKQLACALLYKVMHGDETEDQNNNNPYPRSSTLSVASRLNYLDALEQLLVTPIQSVVNKKIYIDDTTKKIELNISFTGAEDMPIKLEYDLCESYLNYAFHDNYNKRKLPQLSVEDINRISIALRDVFPNTSVENSNDFLELLKELPLKNIKYHYFDDGMFGVEVPGVLPVIPLKLPFNPELAKLTNKLWEVFPEDEHEELVYYLGVLHSKHPFKFQEAGAKTEALLWIDTHIPIEHRDLLEVNFSESFSYSPSEITYDDKGLVLSAKLGNPEYILTIALKGEQESFELRFGGKEDVINTVRSLDEEELNNDSEILLRSGSQNVEKSIRELTITDEGDVVGQSINQNRTHNTVMKMLSPQLLSSLGDEGRTKIFVRDLKLYPHLEKALLIKYCSRSNKFEADCEWHFPALSAFKDVKTQVKFPALLYGL
ncbi:hypothetical protein SOPP22_00660 [Shewanella sp. OPT22]|nr:hypothetical protein SOPP22_00660 [Shewanella sp. OPT22]